MDDLVRPEEARIILEEALRKEPTDYRLHLSYTKVFLHLGFGEEALSSANCALALAPEREKAVAFIERAEAYLLLKMRELALQDLREAITRSDDARELIMDEPSFRPLMRNRRFRSLIVAPPPMEHASIWEHVRKWLIGE